jgi:hypothetical protein
MNATNPVEPTVVGGGLAVAFELIAAGRVVKCTVSRESLQHYFWLQPGAAMHACSRFSMTDASESLPSPNARRVDSRPLLST